MAHHQGACVSGYQLVLLWRLGVKGSNWVNPIDLLLRKPLVAEIRVDMPRWAARQAILPLLSAALAGEPQPRVNNYPNAYS
jgi:hypothetical protein